MNDERLCALLAAVSLLRDLLQEDFAALWERACANRVECGSVLFTRAPDDLTLKGSRY
jgi:hypothetical protein